MKNKKLKIRLGTIGALSVLLVGYTLLVLVIVFREEINSTLTPATATVAEVEVASTEPPAVFETEHKTDMEQLGYIEQILSDPANLRQEKLLPGRAYLEGKMTEFLVGF